MYRALKRFQVLARQASCNHTRTVWVLKCDIRKFFASIDHRCLLTVLKEYIPDADIVWLLENIIKSFYTAGHPNAGLPLGNLTSQLFANVYLNIFDQWVKHDLRVKYYVRYVDDFVFLSEDYERLESYVSRLEKFLQTQLRLELHPNKVFIKTLASGVDFLGWVHFPDHRILRTATKRRMMRRIQENSTPETVQSYLGLLGHGHSFRLKREVLQTFWLSG